MGFINCTPDSSVRAAGLSVALWRALVAAACLGLVAPVMAADPPVNDAAAVERGARVFQQYCTECHGRDGRAQLDVIADATDLTLPAYYYSGSTNEDIYSSIANGAGVAMPAWRSVLGSDEAIWDLVYFVKSLWAEQP